jgi:DNA polymerase-3 subunit delta
MPIELYWGEDDFAIEQAVVSLRDRVLDQMWASFNYTVIPPEQPDGVIQGLNEVMTPPFGAGGRLVWLVDTNLCHQCSEQVLVELKRTLPAIPDNAVLLLTSSKKPDGRLKSSQLFKEYAKIKEFSLIPPWKTELLVQAVNQAARTVGVKLTAKSTECLAEAVGNDTRQLYNELEKLKLYNADIEKAVDIDAVTKLIRNSTQNSLQLAAAIRTGDTGKALALVTDLINASEPGLRIVATLIGQFRTWLWVKLMMEAGERDPQAIAEAAEVGNPKRIYFLQQEVKFLSVQQLLATLPVLLELEVSLKQGTAELSALQTKVIELCQICR